jgi:hypothetical protein
LTFDEAVNAWRAALSRAPVDLLDDTVYAEILDTVAKGMVQHKMYREWATKYRVQTVNGESWLCVIGNPYEKRALSGIHAANAKKATTAAAAAEAAECARGTGAAASPMS